MGGDLILCDDIVRDEEALLTPEGRGRCFWYWGEAGADTFEA